MPWSILRPGKKVCAICFRKASRLLSSSDVESIQNYVIADYAIENQDFPCAICAYCRVLLHKYENGDMKTPFPVVNRVHDIPGTHVLTRGQMVSVPMQDLYCCKIKWVCC